MKHLHLIAFLFSFSIASHSWAQDASGDGDQFRPHWNYYFSFGGGFSQLSGIPSDFYEDGHSNVQLGMYLERGIASRLSLLSGLEIERATFSLDGQFLLQDNSSVELKPASEGMKYTRLGQSSINLPLHFRFYLHENKTRSTPNAYLQLGARLGIGNTQFTYREGGEKYSVDLAEGSRRFIWQGELMLGFKDNFFSCLDLLNSSSIGVIYSISPIFESHSSKGDVRPIHFTWRFIF